MSSHLAAPTSTGQLSNARTRVHDLERRLSKRPPNVPGYIFTASLAGAIYEAESTPDEHPTGGTLERLKARLGTAGSTATVISWRRNGVEFETTTIPAGQRRVETRVNVAFTSDDELTVAVTTVGGGAENLTCKGYFSPAS